MRNVRISVTSIDSWLYYEANDGDYHQLMSDLCGEGVETEAMRVGSALHKALELSQPGETISLQANGYTFHCVGELELALPETREFKVEKEINLGSLSVTLVGKLDAMHGRTIYDHKTTQRFNPDWLLESYQWRNYLNLTGADTFVFNVFELKECEEKEYEITALHTLSQYRYPDLAAQCLEKLGGFVDFLGLRAMRWPSEQCRLADLLRYQR